MARRRVHLRRPVIAYLPSVGSANASAFVRVSRSRPRPWLALATGFAPVLQDHRAFDALVQDSLNREPDQARKLRIGGNLSCPKHLAEKRNRNLCIRNHTCIHRPQSLSQSRLSIFPTCGSIQQCNRFAREFSAPNNPVQRVLQRTGNPCAYSGVEKITAEQSRSAARKRKTASGPGSRSRSGLNGGSASICT
jgi:hypothetical protein